MWHRFTWWLQHDPNAPGLIQAASALLSVLITGALCWITYRYMLLTNQITETSREQLRASVRPIISVDFYFSGGRDSVGGVVFKDRVFITIANAGSNPLIIQKATLGWSHHDDGEFVERAAPFAFKVLAPKEEAKETVIMIINGEAPKVEHFAPWSDFVYLTVECSDLGKIAPEGVKHFV